LTEQVNEMSQRSIPVKENETIIIKAGGSVLIKGDENALVRAETLDRWGLTLERRSESQIGRTQAARNRTNESVDVIEVQFGGNGEVFVPYLSNLKVYAGKDIEIESIGGQVDAYSGLNLELKHVRCLGNASAGWTMAIDCQTMIGENVTFSAGSDLRFHIADLTDVRVCVKDLGGYWEARIGNDKKLVYLKSGGDVTFVTDKQVEALPPNFVLGRIEKPSQV
jgi:hypothetical protein